MRETPLNFENIVAKLAEWERRLGPKESVKEGALSAQIPSKGKGNKGSKGKAKKPKGACFNYGQEGHFKAECPELEGKKEGKKPSTGPLATPSGGGSLSPKQTQAKVAEISWISTIAKGQSGSKVLGYSDQEPIWIVDLGCSRHMTYTRWKFKDYNELDEPIDVIIASGATI
jgi:hypothetical protein